MFARFLLYHNTVGQRAWPHFWESYSCSRTNFQIKSGHIAERQVDKEYVKKESRIREPQPRVDIKQHSKNPDKETVVETDVPLDEEEFEKPKDDGTKDPKFRKSEKKNKQNLQEEQTTAKVPFMVV